jgi:hypothetical protein
LTGEFIGKHVLTEKAAGINQSDLTVIQLHATVSPITRQARDIGH